jgi:hypothetical protein
MEIAFTGPRQLTKEQELFIYKDFSFISSHQANWHVGDAAGLDNFVQRAAGYYNKPLTVYRVEGKQRWQFAERSKRMVDALAGQPDAWLYAFPNKPCPPDCKPCKSPNGSGSGTWLTIAYARYRGLQICLLPQFKSDEAWLPDWMKEPETEQLSLF